MSAKELSKSAIFNILLERPSIKPNHKIVLMVMIANSDWKTGAVYSCRTAIKNQVGCSLNTLDKILKQFENDTVIKVHREFCEKKKAFNPNKYNISPIGLSGFLGVTLGEITHSKGKRTTKKKNSKMVKYKGGVTQKLSEGVTQKLSEGVTQELSEGVTQKLGEGSLKNGCTLTQKMGEGSRKNEDIIPVYEPVSLPVKEPVIDNANTNTLKKTKPPFVFPKVIYDAKAAGKRKAELAKAKADTINRRR